MTDNNHEIRFTVSSAHEGDDKLQIVAYGINEATGAVKTRLQVMPPARPHMVGCLGGLHLESAMQTLWWVAPDAEFTFVIRDDARKALGEELVRKLARDFTNIALHGKLTRGERDNG